VSAGDLAEYIVRRLVDEPDAVRVAEVERDGDLVVQLFVAEADRGKVIGRHGRMVRALRTVVRTAGATTDRRVLLEIVE
jgi:predicted RNA-binding protein YlqC (UPF0109 family)